MHKKGAKLGGSFRRLNAAQFLGAMNDNIFKLLVMAFVIGLHGSSYAGKAAAIAGGVFVVPFLLFSAFAGRLADRFSKQRITIVVKMIEIIVMSLAFAGFLFKSEIMLYAVLFLMAAQSAFFSPSKYGILPELVDSNQIPAANGSLHALTYLAIIAGSFLAPVFLEITAKDYIAAAVGCVLVAVVGFWSALGIERTVPAGGELKVRLLFIADIIKTLSSLRKRKDLLACVFAAASFLLIASFIQLNLIGFSIEKLDFDETQGGYMFLPGALGIGLGAYFAGKVSPRNVELGLIPMAAILLTVSIFLLGTAGEGLVRAIVFIFMAGIAAGLFIVPVHSLIQIRSPRVRRGQVIAASNFLGWVGVLISAGLIYLISGPLNMSAAMGFIFISILILILTILAVRYLGYYLLRFAGVLLVRLVYRLRVVGIENVPAEGGVLLVSNHSSWADAMIINAAMFRRVRFIMDKRFYNKWFLKPICRLMRVIPISSKDSARQIAGSLREARETLKEGFAVCIFAEGAMTRNGSMHSFKNGLEHIAKGSGCKILPVYIGGTWGSIFSYYYGKPLLTLPKRIHPPVSVHIGEAMEADASAREVREKVCELSCDYFGDLRGSRLSLAEHFIKTARRHPFRRCIADSSGKKLGYGGALLASIALSKPIDRLTKKEKYVGILLPPSVGGVLSNIALTMLGKVTVNLNYAVSQQLRDSAIEQCGIKIIITSRKFVEKTEISSDSAEFVFLEDIAGKIGFWGKAKAFLKVCFVPSFWLVRRTKNIGDETATVIFSSGSSGEPKGIMLSHRNIYCNIQMMRSVFRLFPRDNLCAVLPFFHSFGFTCSLWLPVISDVSACYLPNPLDAGEVGRMAREHKSTVLFAAPSFLTSYTRRIDEEDFATLRSVVVGAEKLKRKISENFEEKFGLKPLEGYGATELSPVATLNVPDVEGRIVQVGIKEHSVGKPVPGLVVKVVDVNSFEQLPAGEKGLLMVKGPNVMLGYLKGEEETAEVLQDGWYNTGDIGFLDEEGFLTITDRISRFSKVGGEMVGHLAIEHILLEGLHTDEQVVAVTSAEDEKRIEKLVVFYTGNAGEVDKLHKIICDSELPNIFRPKPENYIKIESMPLLGSGKLDIMKLKKLAAETMEKKKHLGQFHTSSLDSKDKSE